MGYIWFSTYWIKCSKNVASIYLIFCFHDHIVVVMFSLLCLCKMMIIHSSSNNNNHNDNNNLLP